MKIGKIFSLLSELFFTWALAACSGSSGGSSPDISAPAWEDGYPKTVILDTRVYAKAGLNEAGRVFCVLVPDGDPAPGPEQIRSGQNSKGTIVPERANAEVSVNDVATLMIIGLAYSSDYDLYCIAEDGSHNLQASASKTDVSISARDTVFVSKTNGDDTNSGAISAPKATITAGIEYARVNFPFTMARKVCVSQGTYVESVELVDGISLLGGYSKTDWSERDIADRTNGECFTGISGMGAVNFALSISGANSSSGDWIVEGFTVESNDSTNSRSIYCDADSLVKIQYNTISGGSGEDESAGIYFANNVSAEISNNIVDGGSGNTSTGIHVINEIAGTTIYPYIYSNIINGGTGSSITVGIRFEGRGDSMAISPVICNNIICSGTGAANDAHGAAILSIDGHAYFYNNIIHGNITDHTGIFINSESGRNSFASIINNMIFNAAAAVFEYSNSLCDVIKNNDLYNCGYLYSSNTYGDYDSIGELNGSHPWISGNVSADASLDNDWNFTRLSPASVTEGGLDLSAFPYFQENSSGDKIDIICGMRTAPWSIGAYEKD